MRITQIIFVSIFIMTAFCDCSKGANASISGFIRNENGIGVKNASITFGSWRSDDKSALYTAKGDHNGKYKVYKLETGRQSVDIVADNHKKMSMIIDIKEGFQTMDFVIYRGTPNYKNSYASLESGSWAGFISESSSNLEREKASQFESGSWASFISNGGKSSQSGQDDYSWMDSFRIKGFVMDKEKGQPIANATIVADNKTVTTDKNGLFQLNGIKGGNLQYFVGAPFYASHIGEVKIDRDREISIALDPARSRATISGKVLDSEGKPISNAEIKLGNKKTKTQKNGEYRLDNLATGQEEIMAYTDNYLAYSQDIQILPTNQVHDILLENGGNVAKLSGKILDKTSKKPIFQATVMVGDKISTSDRNGHYKFDDLPMGRNTIQILVQRKLVFSQEIFIKSGEQIFDSLILD